MERNERESHILFSGRGSRFFAGSCGECDEKDDGSNGDREGEISQREACSALERGCGLADGPRRLGIPVVVAKLLDHHFLLLQTPSGYPSSRDNPFLSVSLLLQLLRNLFFSLFSPPFFHPTLDSSDLESARAERLSFISFAPASNWINSSSLSRSPLSSTYFPSFVSSGVRPLSSPSLGLGTPPSSISSFLDRLQMAFLLMLAKALVKHGLGSTLTPEGKALALYSMCDPRVNFMDCAKATGFSILPRTATSRRRTVLRVRIRLFLPFISISFTGPRSMRVPSEDGLSYSPHHLRPSQSLYWLPRQFSPIPLSPCRLRVFVSYSDYTKQRSKRAKPLYDLNFIVSGSRLVIPAILDGIQIYMY